MTRIIQLTLCTAFLIAQVLCAPLCAAAKPTALGHSCCDSSKGSANTSLPSQNDHQGCSGCIKALHSEKSLTIAAPELKQFDLLSFFFVSPSAQGFNNLSASVIPADLRQDKAPAIAYLRLAAQASAHAPPSV